MPVCLLAASRLLAKEAAHTPQYAVLLWVIWMILAGDLEDCGEGRGIGVYAMSDFVGDLYVRGLCC